MSRLLRTPFSVGLLGLEPRKTGPESVVLPLHHSPITLYPLRENAANEVGLLGLEPRKTGPESVVLPLHHSPKSIVLSASFDFDGAKVQLFYNIPIFWSFFFKKIQKKKRIKPHSFVIYRKASIFATLIYI